MAHLPVVSRFRGIGTAGAVDTSPRPYPRLSAGNRVCLKLDVHDRLYNIDPFSKFSIEECVEAIREAQLLPSLTVSSSATTKSSSSSSTGSTNVNDDASPGTSSSYNSSVRDLLDFELTENGANLSSGQQQLVCLARALLRRSRMSVRTTLFILHRIRTRTLYV